MYSNGRHDELEPRPVPKPTQFQEISARPEVPELSVVFESSESNYSKPSSKNTMNPPYTSSHTTQETYSEWKQRQNRSSPIHKEPRYYDSREKHYYGSSMYSDCDQNPYGRFSDKASYKSGSDCHKTCACQNAPTVKDIYNMMQIQNDQIKFLLETIQTLLVTVLSNQQTHHKCCCSNNGKNNDSFKATELAKTNDIPKEHQSQNSNDVQKEQPQTTLQKTDKLTRSKNVSNKRSKGVNKTDKTPTTKNKPKSPESSQCNGDVNEKSNKKETERTYSTGSDESFDLNENDVHITETPITPEPSIHIEMKSSSSEDSSNSSDSEKEDNDKQIEVGWTMYKNIIGQVNNLLEDTNSEQKSEMSKPVECVKPTSNSNLKKYEPYTHFILPENGKIDSSLQMQALAMQYLSPEQALKFDMSKHFVPKTQGPVKSPNNYSISTMHYMERYHLIGPEKNYNSENHPQHKLSTDELLNKKKKSSRKSKSPSKILNITELKQQPKLS